MSKALEEVLQYANDDAASIHKHWIIFIKMAKTIIIFSIIVALLFANFSNIISNFGNFINELVPSLPFMISDNLTLLEIMIILLFSLVQFFKTYIIYKTVGLTVNNIQIKGKSGLVDIGNINSSLEQIGYIKTHIPLFGRLFKYGSVEINLHGTVFTMIDMTMVEEFQEAVILLQEAQKEGRVLRSDVRHDATIAKQTIAQVQAVGLLSKTISQALPSPTQNKTIEASHQALLD